jgi:hypothetical protein
MSNAFMRTNGRGLGLAEEFCNSAVPFVWRRGVYKADLVCFKMHILLVHALGQAGVISASNQLSPALPIDPS